MGVSTLEAPLIYIRSDKDLAFTDALIEDAREDESLAFPNEIGRSNEVLIETISIISKENREWDVYLFTKSGFSNADLDLDNFLTVVKFTEVSGNQIATAGSFYYSQALLAIAYKDLDATSKLHISLVNRGIGTKTAGAAGEIILLFGVRPVYFS